MLACWHYAPGMNEGWVPSLDRRTKGRTALAALLTLAVACSGTGARGASTSTAATPPTVTGPSTATTDPTADALPVLDDVSAPDWAPSTRTDELRIAIATGNSTVQLAVDAFNVTYGPMPGATPSTLPPGLGVGTHTALKLIEGVRKQLAPEQLAFLDALDGSAGTVSQIAADGSTTTGKLSPPTQTATTPTSALGFRRRPSVDPVLQKYLALLVRTWGDWKQYRPDFTFPPVQMIMTNQDAGVALMDALYPTASEIEGSPGTFCRIRVFPKLWNGSPTDDVLLTAFAHELFHCVQDTWNPDGGFPSWINEGSANFAAFDLHRGVFPPPAVAVTPAFWFTVRSAALAAREYDSWPLFESFRQSGGDTYAAIKKLYTDAGKDGAPMPDTTAKWLQLGGMNGLAFRVHWSANVVRSTKFSEKEWSMQWPSATDAGPHDNATSIARGVGTYSVHGAKEYGQQQLDVVMSSDVGLVVVIPKVGPLLTHAADGTVAVAEGDSRKFCFDKSGCVCPTGSTSNSTLMDGRDMVFSMAVNEDQPIVDVKAVRWDKKYCHPKDEEKKRGRDNGDPHLVSLDGQAFDVMARGEFVLARDDRGGFQVQVRHADVTALTDPVTGTSAVALGGSDHHRIVFGGDPNSGADRTITIDGSAVADVAEPQHASGIDITKVETDHWLATWADGSNVDLRWLHGWFISLALSSERATHISGMLGNANGDFRDDLVLADGTHVDPSDGATLDGQYAPRWYVETATSLFDYKPGETTETFRTPPPKRPSSSADALATCTAALPPAATRAEVAACAYDLGATGKHDYVDTYTSVITSRIADDPTSPQINTPTSTTVPSTPTSGGSSAVLTGTLASNAGGATDVVEQLTTAIDVKEGSVILGQVKLCAAGVDVRMRATLRGGSGQSRDVYLCDASGFNVPGRSTDQVVRGEGVLWASAGGTYDITIRSSSDQPLFTTVTISTDPSPTIVNAADAVSKGYTGQLSGLADTVVMLPDTGGKAVTWTVVGLDVACGDDHFGLDTLGTGGPAPITFCGHPDSLSLTNSGEYVPFILYAHTTTLVDIKVVPTP